ncbi:hypothetical protein [Hymenobacter mucosus]|uniref:Uncharacterized protein n=1 Tax=Hymenobacter mucosus TaxID=1411120 RepID=A0A238ZVB2_9BACT|nr:hypothetical protein [Hymenobacter mucosus]SNR87347.1 hypothetical protein SAMN06269173_11013 [Hymenobacter mucosus]
MIDPKQHPAAAVTTAPHKRKKYYWFLALIMLSFWVEGHFQERHISKLIFFSSFAVLAQGLPTFLRGLMYGMVTVMCAIMLYSWWAVKQP